MSDQNNQNNKNPDEIEAGIERTRTQLGDDVEAITYQLSPERYREQLRERTQGVQDAVSHGLTGAFDNAGERSRRAGQGFLERLEDDPLPVVLTVLGVSVLTIGGLLGGSKNSGSNREVDLEYPSDRTNLYNSPSGPDYGRTIGDAPNAGALSGDQDLPTEGVDEYDYSGSSTFYDNSADSEDYRREAERQAYQTKRGLVRLVGDHPLITGSLITLVGVIAGLAVPGTRQEDELMGDASNQFKARAERATHEARDVAAKSYQSAKDTAKDEADKQDLNEGREASRDTGSKVKNVAEKVTKDAKDTAQNEAEKKR